VFNDQGKMALNLNKILLSSLLTVILMLPHLGYLSHLFEEHDHKTCEISEIHLHELDLDCHILDYQFSPSLEISSVTDFMVVYSSEQKKFPFFNEGDFYSKDLHDTLRGPPRI
jgi:hypothetical protein